MLMKVHGGWRIAIGFLLLGAGRASAQDAESPTAERILDRYIEVTGGEDAYRRLTTERLTATIEIADAGLKGRFESIKKAPDSMVRKESMGTTGETIRGTDGTIVWEVGPIFGARLLEGVEKAQFLREARFNSALYWREIYRSVETQGVEEVNGEPCDIVVLTPEVGSPEIALYSKASGLLRKMSTTVETSVGAMDIELVLGEYREFDGIKVPTTIAMSLMGTEVRSVIDTLEHNVELPEDAFALPEKVRRLAEEGR